MKVTTATEMSAIDRATTEKHGVSSLVLMENAGTAVADFVRDHWPSANRITVVCGKGNNGGDGLVAARRLHGLGKVVEVLLLGQPKELKADAAAMLSRLPFRPVLIDSAADFAREHQRSIAGADLIIDAIFGTGYKHRVGSSPTQELADAAIAAINAAPVNVPVIAVDLPSGADADSTSGLAEPGNLVCRCTAAITFTTPKPAHVFAPLTRGIIAVAPIGTPAAAIVSALKLQAVSPLEVSALFAPRALDSNKGRFGHVLVIAGSFGKSGAAAMCGTAVLRVGAGLATVATPGSVLPVVAAFTPELMTEPLGDPDAQSVGATVGSSGGAARGANGVAVGVSNDSARCLELAKSRDVIAIGPGLSQRPGVAEFIHRVVKGAHCPVVLDADGLNAFAASPELLRGTHPLILTPHPGEMARLTGESVAAIQSNRVDVAREFARRHRCTLVLKGFRTVIAHPSGEVWVVATGNPGMASGGTGDILTGMIAGAVAQFPHHIEEAVRAAVFLHGLAGDVAARHTGEESLIATDLLRYLPEAFAEMRRWAEGKNIRLR